MCFAGLYQCGMSQKLPREQLSTSLVSLEIQKLYYLPVQTNMASLSRRLILLAILLYEDLYT